MLFPGAITITYGNQLYGQAISVEMNQSQFIYRMDAREQNITEPRAVPCHHRAERIHNHIPSVEIGQLATSSELLRFL